MRRSAPRRFPSRRFDPLRFARWRFFLDQRSLRSGQMSGFSSRHAFQAATPWLSKVTCSSLAIQRCIGLSTVFERSCRSLDDRARPYGRVRG
jgi:hypothetical protein